ncbi:MAG: imidazole glycerol phosphate synthase subunit HisH [Firmicutes bacterium]|nr:imidazole glycerol phosphate synthase subunit HisH [Bacillota bacterium]MBO2522149.1 imidazole glycerol phosphate synthase subunit HisH [Bacillota bacterium]
MIAIVDYGMGNLRSVQKAFERVGFSAAVTSSPEDVRQARGVVVPGVGAFGKAMENLERLGLADAVVEAVREGKPYLGICLGYQLLFESSEERFGEGAAAACGGRSGGAEGDPGAGGGSEARGTGGGREPAGLGLLKGKVRRFPAGVRKVPQIGWNQVRRARETPLFEGVADGSYVYFVHSYFPVPADPGVVAATTEYGVEFASAVCAGHIWAVQFHPEKSSRVGLAILANFGRAVER